MKKLIIVSCCLCISNFAYAETRWYGGVAAGKTYHKPKLSQQTGGAKRNLSLPAKGADHGSLDKTKITDLRLGYHLNSQYSVEVDWRRRGWKAHGERAYYEVEQAKSQHKALMVSGVYRLPMAYNLQAYAKGSVGLARNSLQGRLAQDDVNTLTYAKRAKTKAAYGVGAGVNLAVSKHINLGLDYQYANLGKSHSHKAANGSRLNSNYKGGELMGSLTINF
ncbi:Opacity protein [Thiothrix eikelboomii]|uniref:Opacity protein n=1 Tax=Thiothrix eikelboomii TaxID=92487 RepID=A0A1T4W865_9GAMM|nr:outer membrane beta-barrel protein [Thiothrix eikelboomii]SKA73228.1 Opacity protein [Thiothrix eikelboomii]